MNRIWARAISLFFLLVFLYPVLEKSIHELSHDEHQHCNSFSQYHIHEQEHRCGICEFTLPVALVPVESSLTCEVTSVSSWMNTSVEHPDTGPAFPLFLLRAPPMA